MSENSQHSASESDLESLSSEDPRLPLPLPTVNLKCGMKSSFPSDLAKHSDSADVADLPVDSAEDTVFSDDEISAHSSRIASPSRLVPLSPVLSPFERKLCPCEENVLQDARIEEIDMVTEDT